MDFISTRFQDGKFYVLLEEVFPQIDQNRFNLLVKSGKLKTYEIDEPLKVEYFQTELSKTLDRYAGIKSPEFKFYPGGARCSIWAPGMKIDRIFVALDEISGLIVSDEQTQKTSVDQMPVDAFVKSIKADALKFWEAVKPGRGKESFRKAIDFLKQNPGLKITECIIKPEDFEVVTKGKERRAVLGKIIQRILSANGYGALNQNEIETLLK